MIRFPTVYSSREPVYSETGSPVCNLYSPAVKADGSFTLEVVGKRNIYDEIQSHADSCDLKLILERFARGEVDVLSRRQGLYGDVTAFPTTYAEMLNVIVQAQAEFDAFPVSVKERFDNDVNKFIARMDDVELMRELFPPKKDDAVKEVLNESEH